MRFNLQLFAEENLRNQTSNQLRKGICSFQKRIDEHWQKINNPEKYCVDWHSRNDRAKIGLIKHWLHEIKNFAESIQNRVDELNRRGEQP